MPPDRWTEPGRSVNDSGAIVYAWPPEGRFAALWQRFEQVFEDDQKHDLLALLLCWRDEDSTLVAYTDEAGEWVDVEPNWDELRGWLDD